MKFTLTIPSPQTMKIGKETFVTLDAETDLHRLHLSQYVATQFNNSGKGSARFSPICKTDGSVIPTIYAAQSFETAVCEIILRCPDDMLSEDDMPSETIVFPSDFADYSHSHIRLKKSVLLVDLTTSGQRKIGIDRNVLVTGPTFTYPDTRAWAEKIHAACPSAQGLYYTSLQNGPEYAVVLFGDRVPQDAFEGLSTRTLVEEECHDEVCSIADSLSIDYVEV